jgi:endo-1,4-beta-D-glucanase Y
MVAFALMAGTGIYADPEAKTYFDGMYKFFMAHPFRSGDYLMSWAVNSNGSGGETFSPSVTATDGDLDIGYALVLANYQWGANGSINYLDEAEKVIAAIKRYEMNPNNKRVMLCDYHDWSDQSHHQYWLSRCSDWMADHLRTFNEVTGDSYWNDAVSTIYSVYNYVSSNYSSATGLVPDWINYDPPQPHSYAGKTHYSYDACRFPWRIATDFAHNGSSSAKAVLNKISGWIISKTGGEPRDIMAEYELDGTAIGNYTSAAFTSPFLVACMADKSATSQTFLDKGWNVIKSEQEGYYEDTINLLCMLLMSGNWWKPEPYSAIGEKNYNAVPSKTRFIIRPGVGNRSFTVSYSLPKDGAVQIGIYATNGRLIHLVNNKYKNAGNHTTAVSLENDLTSSGVYYGMLTVDGVKQLSVFSVVR